VVLSTTKASHDFPLLGPRQISISFFAILIQLGLLKAHLLNYHVFIAIVKQICYQNKKNYLWPILKGKEPKLHL
jgi:hypothetical protein